tara:strand:- start:2415 stop:3182 length:768 start_codon:yes stop_codon:yes gene_type:complete
MDSKIKKFYNVHEDGYIEKIIDHISKQENSNHDKNDIIEIVKKIYCDKYLKIDWFKLSNLRRWNFINASIRKIRSDKLEYLEIGVFRNENFNQINCINKTSVDPDPKANATHKITSDEFFSKNKKKFDVIFIDGLHDYKQCQTDAVNALKCLNANGYIFFHDFVPRNFLEEYTPRIVKIWTGDVWKVSIELANTSGIEFSVILADHGLGIIKKINETVEYAYQNKQLEDLRFNHFLDLNKVVNYKDAEEAFGEFS